MPYAIVGGTQAKLTVAFHSWDESDGADRSTSQGLPFYSIPGQAISQPQWIEAVRRATSINAALATGTCRPATAAAALFRAVQRRP
jgi:hypothetical protein